MGYVSSYLHYFWQGHSVLEWLRGQKWMLHFYLNGGTTRLMGGYWLSIFTGWHRDHTQAKFSTIQEWSWLWPAIMLTVLAKIGSLLKKKSTLPTAESYILVVLLGLSSFFTILPFFPRYFLLILVLGLPWALLFWSRLLQVALRHYPQFAMKVGIGTVVGLLTVLTLLQSLFFWRAQPVYRLQFGIADWQKTNYQDLYSYLNPSLYPHLSRTDFHIRLKEIDQAMQAEKKRVTFYVPWVWPWQNTVEGSITTRTTTPLGTYTRRSPAYYTRIGNHWYIDWRWDYLWPEATINQQPRLNLTLLPDAPLKTQDNVLLSQPGMTSFLVITSQ